MHISIENIERILLEEDIEGLIEQGAPSDEYASEAQAIYEMINGLSQGTMTLDQLEEGITNVWQQSFGLDKTSLVQRISNIRKIAKKISGPS